MSSLSVVHATHLMTSTARQFQFRNPRNTLTFKTKKWFSQNFPSNEENLLEKDRNTEGGTTFHFTIPQVEQATL